MATAQAVPIISGGKIYVLTDRFGLQVLGDSEVAAATQGDGVADLRTPVNCDSEATENPLLSNPEADVTPIPAYVAVGTSHATGRCSRDRSSEHGRSGVSRGD